MTDLKLKNDRIVNHFSYGYYLSKLFYLIHKIDCICGSINNILADDNEFLGQKLTND